MASEPDAEFSALVQRQSRFVFKVAYSVLLNPHDAEDAVQEVFLKLYRNRGWEKAENERAFLARVTWRVALDLRPRALRSVQMDMEPEVSPERAEVSPSGPDPEQQALVTDHNALVHSLIDSLPQELRLPLVLSAFDELTSREIAGVLGIADGTVRTRLQRARQMLRQKLEIILRNQESRYV